jgi:SAM-dependent MidA family methyltransferase
VLSSPDREPVSPAFARGFARRAGGAGVLAFADFMDLALYDPECGYYRAPRQRVGRRPETDFATACSLPLAFAPLVAAAATGLLSGGEEARRHAFVEIGAEPGPPLLAGAAHDFASVRAAGLGEPLDLGGPSVVFTNELFDAQPFHRAVFSQGRWRELGVGMDGGRLAWVELDRLSPALAETACELPKQAPDGYLLDVPVAAVRLLETIARQPWSGLFLAFDYGRSWTELTSGFPDGTGRAYHRHRRQDDLLAAPGEQDLTCHVCWDWLERALAAHGFAAPRRESQEAFFVHHASAAIAGFLQPGADPRSPALAQLKELLHPAFMGQKFEALWARRR